MELLTYPPAFGQFSASPFCTKAAFLLTMSGRAWQRRDMLDPRKMPFGKLPALLDEGRLIPDSDNIRRHLEARGAEFDAGLSDLDRANARAFIRMAEEHLYFHLVLDRWGNDEVWPIIRDTYFTAIPHPIRRLVAGRIRKSVLQGMHAQGLGRFSEKERIDRLEPDIDSICARLWHGKFLFGDTPTSADASIAPMLSAMIATPKDTRLKQLISGNRQVVDYLDRMERVLG